MKAKLRKFFFNRKNRWIPILLFILGFGMQIAAKWLPTLVVCYKANEKPKIEFLNDVCACRNECPTHSLSGHNECGAKFQSDCLDVPLLTDQGYGTIPRIIFLQGSKSGPARELFAKHLPNFLFSPSPEIGLSPPRRERTNNGSCLAFQTGGIDSLLCRFRC
jgi:hypothetical protein